MYSRDGAPQRVGGPNPRSGTAAPPSSFEMANANNGGTHVGNVSPLKVRANAPNGAAASGNAPHATGTVTLNRPAGLGSFSNVVTVEGNKTVLGHLGGGWDPKAQQSSAQKSSASNEDYVHQLLPGEDALSPERLFVADGRGGAAMVVVAGTKVPSGNPGRSAAHGGSSGSSGALGGSAVARKADGDHSFQAEEHAGDSPDAHQQHYAGAGAAGGGPPFPPFNSSSNSSDLLFSPVTLNNIHGSSKVSDRRTPSGSNVLGQQQSKTSQSSSGGAVALGANSSEEGNSLEVSHVAAGAGAQQFVNVDGRMQVVSNSGFREEELVTSSSSGGRSAENLVQLENFYHQRNMRRDAGSSDGSDQRAEDEMLRRAMLESQQQQEEHDRRERLRLQSGAKLSGDEGGGGNSSGADGGGERPLLPHQPALDRQKLLNLGFDAGLVDRACQRCSSFEAAVDWILANGSG